MNNIAPTDMRQHWMLNESRLSTDDELAQEIEDYWDATEEISRDDKGQAGFIAPVGEAPCERWKTKWTAVQLSKEWHEGQRTNAQRTRIPTRVVSRDVASAAVATAQQRVWDCGCHVHQLHMRRNRNARQGLSQ